MKQQLDRAVVPNPFRTLVLRTLTKFAGTDAELTDCADEICEAVIDKDDKIDALRTENAMLRETCRTSYSGEDIRAERWHAEQDKARLDWLKHGIKFMHEEGACGHADLWTVYDEDWSTPLGTGQTLRAAIDAAIISGANK